MLKRPRYSILIFTIIVISGCATLTLQEHTHKVGSQYAIPLNLDVLDEAAIRTKIVGNTLVGKSPQNYEEYVEYYLPDGTIRGLWAGTRYKAKWAVLGHTWCAEYEGGSRSCFIFSLDGDSITLYNTKGKILEKATLLSGNARGL